MMMCLGVSPTNLWFHFSNKAVVLLHDDKHMLELFHIGAKEAGDEFISMRESLTS
jgi:hypothetical protein